MNYSLIESPTFNQITELKNNFSLFVKKQLPNLPPESEDKIFMVIARDETNTLVGGVLANCYWDGLEIDILWVDDSGRERGLGRKLLEKAEIFGIENNAVISFLKTVEAKGFYEKMGYQVYGVLEDRPIGTLLYHMKKRL
jgi:GNAT superfamily N-acetyltransferase